MTNEEKVPVGVFTLKKSPGKGAAMTIKRTLLSHLKGAHVSGVDVKVEDNDVVVYGNPVISILQDFVEKSRRGKLEVNLAITEFTSEGLCAEDRAKLEQLEHDYKAKEKEAEIAQGNYNRIHGELAGKIRELKDTKKQLGEAGKRISILNGRNEALETQVLSDRVLTGDSDPEHLLGVLGANLDLYLKNEERVIANVFAQIEEAVESRTLYQETDELRKARASLENRAQVIERLGEEGLELLDEEIRASQQERWEQAEQTVRDHEGKVKPLSLPVRIAIIDEFDSYVVTAPVTADTTNEVGNKVNGVLAKITEQVKAKKGYGEVVEGTRFATMLVRGTDLGELKKLIDRKFREITEETGITANPFSTPYYSGDKVEEIINMRDKSLGRGLPEPGKVYEGLDGLKAFIKDRGYSAASLSREIGMKHATQMYDILRGKVTNPTRKTQQKIARGLGIPVGNLREMTGWK